MIHTEILGQPKATRLLGRALASSRLAHAYLLHGPDGVGKTTAALNTAATLLCRNHPASIPCGDCAGCAKFASANHPDFLRIRPDGATIKISQIRTLKKELSFPPLESLIRVVLIEDVHTMRREAANSLLKMLEEPPPDNILLLTADDYEPLLETIVSRCQLLPFYHLPLETTAHILMRLDPDLDEDEAGTLAALSGGSPGRAGALNSENLLQRYNTVMDGLLADHDSAAEQTEAALFLAATTAADREGLETMLALLRIFFKEVMSAILRDADQASLPSYMARHIVRARERWNLAQLSDTIQAVDLARHALARNCNRQMVCEVLFLDLPANIGKNHAG